MPRNYRRAHRIPPVVYDRGTDLGLAAALVAFGLRALTDPAVTPASVSDLGACLPVIFRIASLIGGAATLIGILLGATVAVGRTAATARKRARRAAFGRSLQGAGLWLVASAWSSYGVALAASSPSPRATLVMLTLVLIGIGCALRAVGLRHTEAAILHTLRDVNAAGAAQDQAQDRGHA